MNTSFKLFLALYSILSMYSCQSDNTKNDLTGTWKMDKKSFGNGALSTGTQVNDNTFLYFSEDSIYEIDAHNTVLSRIKYERKNDSVYFERNDFYLAWKTDMHDNVLKLTTPGFVGYYTEEYSRVAAKDQELESLLNPTK